MHVVHVFIQFPRCFTRTHRKMVSKHVKENRGKTWTHDEIMTLIELWADDSIQGEFEKVFRTAGIYQKLSERLQNGPVQMVRNLYYFSFIPTYKTAKPFREYVYVYNKCDYRYFLYKFKTLARGFL